MSIDDLKQLSSAEKLKIIETLWADLLAQETHIPSPDWHEDELKRTEESYKSGAIQSIPWSEAKKAIRMRFE